MVVIENSQGGICYPAIERTTQGELASTIQFFQENPELE